MKRIVKRTVVTVAGVLLALPAYAQGTPQAPSCPDYSQSLALGLQAMGNRDYWQGQAMRLDQQVTELRKELKEAEEKAKACPNVSPKPEAKPEVKP